MAEYWPIKSDNLRLNVAIIRCLFAPETSLHFAGQISNLH